MSGMQFATEFQLKHSTVFSSAEPETPGQQVHSQKGKTRGTTKTISLESSSGENTQTHFLNSSQPPMECM